MTPQEVLEIYIRCELSTDSRLSHILGRFEIEGLDPGHLYRWSVDSLNRALQNVGPAALAGKIPPLHFDLVRVSNGQAEAHALSTQDYSFIVFTQPMCKQIWDSSWLVAEKNQALLGIQYFPGVPIKEIANFIYFLRLLLVVSHEFAHHARLHFEGSESAADWALFQGQELDADAWGLWILLDWLLLREGRQLALTMLSIAPAEPRASAAIFDCFLLAVMTQFCGSWTRSAAINRPEVAIHPPVALRIDNIILVTEMFCREVLRIATTWFSVGSLRQLFAMAAESVPTASRPLWDQEIAWLSNDASETYQAHLRKTFDALRTTIPTLSDQ